MPNWCENSVTFTHEDPEMIKRVVKSYNEGKLFNEFVPCPPDLLREAEVGDDYRERAQVIANENTEKYGYSSWYDYNINNWGTKWDINNLDNQVEVDSENPNSIRVYFDTAWSPPITFYETMSDDFGFMVDATYHEPGMCFMGRYTSEDGDDSYEYDFDDRDTLEEIPVELRESYDLEQQFDDWASEQEELLADEEGDDREGEGENV